MNSHSLYRKYRPSNFANLVGQDHIKTTLIQAIQKNSISHSYIFAGPRGTGKTTTARLMAKAINCQNLKNSFEPCEECDFCRDISLGNLIDVIEIDAASHTSVENVRDLNETIAFAPTIAKKKVYIIDEFHMLSKSAFNALLKTLEEPPSFVYFILATTELHKIPETIISRCQNFDFKRISINDLKDRLSFIANAEKIEYEENALLMIAKHSNGGLRDAIVFLEQLAVHKAITEKNVSELLGITSIEMLNNFYETIKTKNTENALIIVEQIYNSGIDLKIFLRDFINLLREKILLCIEKKLHGFVPVYYNLIEIFKDAKNNIDPEMPKLTLEIASIKATFAFKDIGSEEAPIITKALESNREHKSSLNNYSNISSLNKTNETTQKTSNTSTGIKTSLVKESNVKNFNKDSSLVLRKENLLKDSASIKVKTDEMVSENSKENKNTTSIQSSNENETVVNNFVSSIDNITKEWLSVLKHISTPKVQRSLQTGKPFEINDEKIILKFFSSFHNEVVMKDENKIEVEDALLKVTGKKFLIDSIVEEKNFIEEEIIDNTRNFAPPAKKNQEDTKVDKMTSKALDIFGGNIL